MWWLLKHVRLEQVGRTHSTGMLSCFSLCLLPPKNEVWDKVMFSQASVFPQVGCLPLSLGGVCLWDRGCLLLDTLDTPPTHPWTHTLDTHPTHPLDTYPLNTPRHPLDTSPWIHDLDTHTLDKSPGHTPPWTPPDTSWTHTPWTNSPLDRHPRHTPWTLDTPHGQQDLIYVK